MRHGTACRAHPNLASIFAASSSSRLRRWLRLVSTIAKAMVKTREKPFGGGGRVWCMRGRAAGGVSVRLLPARLWIKINQHQAMSQTPALLGSSGSSLTSDGPHHRPYDHVAVAAAVGHKRINVLVGVLWGVKFTGTARREIQRSAGGKISGIGGCLLPRTQDCRCREPTWVRHWSRVLIFVQLSGTIPSHTRVVFIWTSV